jgi:predicted ATPase with chaperone activity
MSVEVPPLTKDELTGRPRGEQAQWIGKRVTMAREIQKRRFAGSDTGYNAHMTIAQQQRYATPHGRQHDIVACRRGSTEPFGPCL